MARDTTKMQERTKIRHQKVRDYFDNLYNKKRKRIDDAIKETAEEFTYSVATVEMIIKDGQSQQSLNAI